MAGVAGQNRTRAGLAVVVALAGLASLPGSAAATPVPVSVTGSAQVKTTGTTTLNLRCPRGSAALAASVTSSPSGATPRDSVPVGFGRWTFRFTSLAGADSGRARAVLRCLRLRRQRGMSEVRFQTHTGRTELLVPALSSRKLRVACASGFAPTGYGVDRAFRGSGDPTLPEAELRLVSAVQSSGSWVFRIENSGGSDSRAVVRSRCVRRLVTGRRGGRLLTQTLQVRRAGFVDSVGRGSTEPVSHSCPGGHFSLGLGQVLSLRDDIFVRLAFPRGARSGRWIFDHQTGASQRVRTYLSCLSLGTRFG